jgi:7-cyano-7-deazaguanine synthase
MKKAFVLLSGGLDSTTVLYRAMKECDDCEAVSINYNQRHGKELSYAAATCARLGISHTVLQLGDMLGKSMLNNPDEPIPDKHYDEIEGVSPTVVPFRNGVMLALLASFACEWVRQVDKAMPDNDVQAILYFGAHADDANNWAYPDCTPEFIGAIANAVYVGSYHSVRLAAPYQFMNKAEIVKEGHALGVPFRETWSCYAGGENHCGKCPTCYSRKEAFLLAGVVDPTTYDVGSVFGATTTHLSASMTDK